MSYVRVLPRDLFNEAKLLKCLGQLALIVHNGRDCYNKPPPAGLKLLHDHVAEFTIEQRESDGGIECMSVLFVVGSVALTLYTPLNSKVSFPLLLETDKLETIEVFRPNGAMTPEFIEAVTAIAQAQS